jgi:hypothetical protein
MKKILAVLALVGASIGAFLLWKRNQVNAALEIQADPWPAAVSTPPAPDSQVEEAPVAVASVPEAPAAKKSAKKTAKKTAKKAVDGDSPEGS